MECFITNGMSTDVINIMTNRTKREEEISAPFLKKMLIEVPVKMMPDK